MMNKLLKKLLSPISSANYQQELRNARNIQLRLQQRALDSTCDYIENNMSDLLSVSSREEVLNTALKKVTVDGTFCEFGVYQGYTLNHIKNRISDTLHGFDSFKGLPEFWRDGFGQKAFELPNSPKFSGNVKIHEGYFEDSLPSFLENHSDVFAFVHIDCDLYSATKTIFSLCKERFVPGTVICFDEYFNFPGWQNDEFKAFQEFISETGFSYDYITFNTMHTQVAIVLK